MKAIRYNPYPLPKNFTRRIDIAIISGLSLGAFAELTY
jgi:hypothetical protein